MNYVNGDLIELALAGKFDVITHGCNCFNRMGSGIAVPMKKAFKCDRFTKEMPAYEKDYNKLGTVEARPFQLKNGKAERLTGPGHVDLIVINSYTQYAPGRPTFPYDIPLDYDALMMCFRKINFRFGGEHLGIPQIGCGLAGGDWDLVEEIIDEETPDMEVTCVIYNG